MLRRGKACRLFPTPLSPLAAFILRCARDRFLLTKPNTSSTVKVPASLRSDGLRVHPGVPFGLPPETAFGFAGILTKTNQLAASPVLRADLPAIFSVFFESNSLAIWMSVRSTIP